MGQTSFISSSLKAFGTWFVKKTNAFSKGIVQCTQLERKTKHMGQKI
jgi:hypothetical protein